MTMTNKLELLRQEIDSIDAQIFDLFKQRLTVAKQIGAYKKEQDLAVLDSSREDAKRDQVKTSVSPKLEPYALELLEVLMKAAKAVQETSDELQS